MVMIKLLSNRLKNSKKKFYLNISDINIYRHLLDNLICINLVKYQNLSNKKIICISKISTFKEDKCKFFINKS